MYQFLLTLLLLFLAPHDTALDQVMNDDGSVDCHADWYLEAEHDYYSWESCLFLYSGTYEDDPTLSREDHQALYEKVWNDYMGEVDPPKLRRGQAAIEDVCEPLDDDGEQWPLGCFDASYEPCGPWLMCLAVETVAVKDTSRRTLLHEVAHAIHDISLWHPFWGSGSWGADLATAGHPPTYRCLLLEIYRTYDGGVADDAYKMLSSVCTASGWH